MHKKIGILTLPLINNVGGILQCYALSTILINLGYSPIILNRRRHESRSKKIAKKIIYKLKFLKIKKINNIIIEINKVKFGENLHRDFLYNNLPPITEKLTCSKSLLKACLKNEITAVIVGSDQVWRKTYINDKYYENYFLDFLPENIQKIAYSASFGKEYWEDKKNITKISELLNKFSGISVREKSGIDVCKKQLNVKLNINHTLDPTLLLDKEFYLKLIENKEKTNVDIASYILDNTIEKKNIIDKISKEYKNKNIQIKEMNETEISVLNWLNNIRNADYIITDSFHGMIFSLIFEKNFSIFINKNRGSERFLSILKKLNLEHKIITNNEISEVNKSPIDYLEINKIIKIEKEKSLGFIKENLNG